MKKIFAEIDKKMQTVKEHNVKQVELLDAKIDAINAQYDKAGDAAKDAFDSLDMDAYYKEAAMIRELDNVRKDLVGQRHELEIAGLITKEEYTTLLNQIIEINNAQKAKAEQAACEHIIAIKTIAEESIRKSEAARELIHELQYDIYRNDGKHTDLGAYNYVVDDTRKIGEDALQTLVRYMCDETYPTTSYVYCTYSHNNNQ